MKCVNCKREFTGTKAQAFCTDACADSFNQGGYRGNEVFVPWYRRGDRAVRSLVLKDWNDRYPWGEDD